MRKFKPLGKRYKFLVSKFIKQIIYINVIILLLVVGYKIYLQFHEPDFADSNFENIKILETSTPKDDYSFVVFGSVESSISVFQKKIIGKINKDNGIEFAVSTGDAVLDGAEDKYQILHKSLEMLTIPSIVGVGTREISDGGESRFYRHFGPYYFSYSYGSSYFIFIDTTGLTAIEVQKDWISSELDNAKSYDHIFVFMNDAPIKTSEDLVIQTNHYIENKELRTFLLRELSVHHVDGVFTNGSLMYIQKTVSGIPYYISGGAGGLLYKGAKDSSFHYLRVNVDASGVVVKSITEPLVTNQALIQKIERLWIYIHSIFYVNFINVLLVAFGALLLFLLLYRKAAKSSEYYRDFSIDSNEIVVKEKLTIAIFTDNYFPFIGGVPISIRRLAVALRERGNRVIIYAPDYPQLYHDEVDVIRCKLFYYHKRGIFQFPCTNTISPKIEKSFRQYPFDVVHVNHPFMMGRKGIALGKKYGIPVVFTYHTRIDQYAENIPFLRWIFKNILSHRMVRKFAQKCNGIIAPTKTAKEYLENIGVSRHKAVLPTGVDFGEFNPSNEKLRNQIVSRYAPQGEILLCSASRLAIEKNIAFLIHGLKLVKGSSKVAFRCLMLGDGPEKENIRELIKECGLEDEVILVGQVPPTEMATYFQAADIFVFSSLSETQGMVLLEAMAGGCPVVCVRSSGTDDVIQDGYNGYKTGEDSAQWAEKVVFLLENQKQLKEMSRSAYAFAQNFSEEKIAERVEAFYKKSIVERIKIKGEKHE
jgi:1,2-diacylglycerol 3-alpha-glucosyltransferase